MRHATVTRSARHLGQPAPGRRLGPRASASQTLATSVAPDPAVSGRSGENPYAGWTAYHRPGPSANAS